MIVVIIIITNLIKKNYSIKFNIVINMHIFLFKNVYLFIFLVKK